MIESLKVTKYRAVLGDEGDGDDRDFLIVTVIDNGSVSWASVTEQVFNDCGCDDLPEDLYGQLNAVFGKLHLNDGPVE